MRVQYLLDDVGGFIRLTAETPEESYDLNRVGGCVLTHYASYENCVHDVQVIDDDDGTVFIDLYVISDECIKRFNLETKFQEEIKESLREES